MSDLAQALMVAIRTHAGQGADLCERCGHGSPAFDPKPDVAEWTCHKATDPSWAEWRETEGRAG